MSNGNDLSMTKGDQALLDAWATSQDEAAFHELVRRHGGLLTGMARRRLTEPDLAADIAGRAFALMAQRPERVRRGEVVGWLVQVTLHLSTAENRGTQRRRAREVKASQEFARMHNPMNPPAEDLSATIDQLLLTLNGPDRECLLLHATEGLNYREVGERLGVSEDAARMRTQRIIERLRRRLGLSSSGMAAALSRWKVDSLSSSEASLIAGTALRGSAPAIDALTLGWILMTQTQRITLIVTASLLLLGGVGGTYYAFAALRRSPTTEGSVAVTPDYARFEGTWTGKLAYIVRRTGRKVTLRANSKIRPMTDGLEINVSYDDPNWAVKGRVRVLRETRQLIFEDKGKRQNFRLVSTAADRFVGERFVDEPGRPHDERISFTREQSGVRILIEERLAQKNWQFANEHLMEGPR